jgi:hypothetical protein
MFVRGECKNIRRLYEDLGVVQGEKEGGVDTGRAEGVGDGGCCDMHKKWVKIWQQNVLSNTMTQLGCMNFICDVTHHCFINCIQTYIY